MSDRRTTYLLPCSCGREISIEPQQAGETVRCECGRTCSVPTMREVRSLPPDFGHDPRGDEARLGNSAEILRGGFGGIRAGNDSSRHSLSPISRPLRRTSIPAGREAVRPEFADPGNNTVLSSADPAGDRYRRARWIPAPTRHGQSWPGCVSRPGGYRLDSHGGRAGRNRPAAVSRYLMALQTGDVQRSFCVWAPCAAWSATPDLGVAETDIAPRYGTTGFSRRYATKNACGDRQPWLKPTATIVTSLRDKWMAPGISTRNKKSPKLCRAKGVNSVDFAQASPTLLAQDVGKLCRFDLGPTRRKAAARGHVAKFEGILVYHHQQPFQPARGDQHVDPRRSRSSATAASGPRRDARAGCGPCVDRPS